MELRNTELAVDLRQCREQVVQQQKCWVVEQLRTMYEAKTEKVKHKAADSEHALSKETSLPLESSPNEHEGYGETREAVRTDQDQSQATP
ncbi:uncharacterized protein KRP23_10869 [Phytophthora ramorum]|uniref:uncharacterized protein n=1 Tax=Phytophthora ramorum TaxID=164328 RepID=UPI0030B7321D|nr:hypothetical protein KRP23_10869 [Phytophthora ramorum]